MSKSMWSMGALIGAHGARTVQRAVQREHFVDGQVSRGEHFKIVER